MAPSFTVLVADDDSAVRAILVQALRERGFRVFVAADGHEGLRVLGSEHVDLLIADVIMPVMDGVRLAMQARLMRPGIKLLFATGYAQTALDREAMRLGPVLFKPLRQSDLIREVNMLLSTA